MIFSAVLAAQEPAPSADKTQPAPAVAASAVSEMRSSLLIDPKSRAHDFVQAFELLRREKPATKINIQTPNGPIANIQELSVADNGTLMMVKVPFTQGTKYVIVPIEDIQEIAYSP